jgi:hypothetical protein
MVGGAPSVCIRNLPHAAGASYGSTATAHTIAGEARQMWAQKLSGLLDAEVASSTARSNPLRDLHRPTGPDAAPHPRQPMRGPESPPAPLLRTNLSSGQHATRAEAPLLL